MLVSVVIPCYNVEQYISECIESVLAQTHSEIEIICVDNNSTDNTIGIISEYARRHPSKIVVEKECKKGASAARNKGLMISKGEWIQFLDADDLLMPTKIEHQLELIQNKMEAPFVAAACEKQSVDGKKRKVYLTETDAFKGLFTSGLGITSANFFKASNVLEIGGWNEALKSSQEADLMFRLLKINSEIVFDNVPFTIIRERNAGQISQVDPNKNWLQYIELRLQILNYLKTEKNSYFTNQEDFFYQKLFLQLKRLSKFDIKMAEIYFKMHFEKEFKPHLNPVYNLLYKMFGFKVALRIMNTFG